MQISPVATDETASTHDEDSFPHPGRALRRRGVPSFLSSPRSEPVASAGRPPRTRLPKPLLPWSYRQVLCRSQKVALETVEITDSYPGVIEPFERFALGFEIGGRVVALGVNSSGEPLDDGDRVEKGQVLAKLDDRVLRARVEEIEAQIKETKARQGEAAARHAEADADWTRLQQVQQTNPEAITEATRDQTETDLKVANSQLEVIAAQASMLDAQLAIAKKALEDADLLSPVAGVISRRLVNPGESVHRVSARF